MVKLGLTRTVVAVLLVVTQTVLPALPIDFNHSRDTLARYSFVQCANADGDEFDRAVIRFIEGWVASRAARVSRSDQEIGEEDMRRELIGQIRQWSREAGISSKRCERIVAAANARFGRQDAQPFQRRRTTDGRYDREPGKSPEDAWDVIVHSSLLRTRLERNSITRKEYRMGWLEVADDLGFRKDLPPADSTIASDLDALLDDKEKGLLERKTMAGQHYYSLTPKGELIMSLDQRLIDQGYGVSDGKNEEVFTDLRLLKLGELAEERLIMESETFGLRQGGYNHEELRARSIIDAALGRDFDLEFYAEEMKDAYEDEYTDHRTAKVVARAVLSLVSERVGLTDWEVEELQAMVAPGRPFSENAALAALWLFLDDVKQGVEQSDYRSSVELITRYPAGDTTMLGLIALAKGALLIAGESNDEYLMTLWELGFGKPITSVDWSMLDSADADAVEALSTIFLNISVPLDYEALIVSLLGRYVKKRLKEDLEQAGGHEQATARIGSITRETETHLSIGPEAPIDSRELAIVIKGDLTKGFTKRKTSSLIADDQYRVMIQGLRKAFPGSKISVVYADPEDMKQAMIQRIRNLRSDGSRTKVIVLDDGLLTKYALNHAGIKGVAGKDYCVISAVNLKNEDELLVQFANLYAMTLMGYGILESKERLFRLAYETFTGKAPKDSFVSKMMKDPYAVLRVIPRAVPLTGNLGDTAILKRLFAIAA